MGTYRHHLNCAKRNRRVRCSASRERAKGLDTNRSSGTNLKFTDLRANVRGRPQQMGVQFVA